MMIMETIKTDGSHVFHEVKVFMVCKDGSLSIRDCDNELLSITDFSIYVRLRLLSNDGGRVLHTVRDDVPRQEIPPEITGTREMEGTIVRPDPETWR